MAPPPSSSWVSLRAARSACHFCAKAPSRAWADVQPAMRVID